MKLRLSKFKPALGLANAHLMTLAPLAMHRSFPLTDSVSEKLIIDVDAPLTASLDISQSQSETALTPSRNQVIVVLHRPEQLAQKHKNYAPLTKGLSKKLVLIVHGLEGSVESSYVKGLCEKALSIGFSVCRVNLRNCGNTLHLAQGLYNAGMSEDVVAIAAELKKRFAFEQIFISGFSLGGNIVLKAAGEQGQLVREGSQKASNLIDAVCAVCPPVELEQCVTTIERGENWIYEHGFLISLKEKVKAKNRLFPGRFDIELLPSISSLRGFDNTFTAPDAGYADAAAYYHGASALRVVKLINIPTLVVAAVDDPLVPISSFAANEIVENGNVTLLTPKNGGHVAFVSASDIYLNDLAHDLKDLSKESSITKATRPQLRDRFWSEWQVVQFFLSLSC
ncbi:hypothetical protein BH11CYA1_BH11CYA1_31620 [soil metagenome]